MARPIRVEFEDAVYHVTARGNARQKVFDDDADRRRFLDALAEAQQRFGLLVHAYCLMPNHYHVLTQTPRANLSQAMGWLQTTFTIRHNRRHGRCGHVLQGRFKAHLVEADEYARTLVRYIHLNPVRPPNHRRPVPVQRRAELRRYVWSSHRAYAGLCEAPPWLCLEWLSYWGRTRRAAVRAYAEDIDAAFGQAVASPWEELRGGLVLGGQKLWDRVRGLLAGRGGEEELHWRERIGREASQRLAAALAAEQQDGRVALWVRVRLGGGSVTQIARELDYADPSGVTRVVQRLEARAGEERELGRRLADLRRRFAISIVKS